MMTGCLNKKSIITMALFAILFSATSARGATECRFENGLGGTTTLINGPTSGPARAAPRPSSGGTFLMQFTTDISPGIQIGCSLGNDGTSEWGMTDPSVYAGSLYQDGTFQTNIPGIVYEVIIQTVDGIGHTFGTNTTGYQELYVNNVPSNWNGKWVNAKVLLWQTSAYHGNPNKVSVIKPVAGTLGLMGLGDPNDSNNRPWYFKVTEDTFQIPLVLPTCDVATLADGGNTVELGDYFVSDIQKNQTRDVPFAVQVSNCTSVAKFTTKLSTSKITGGAKKLLANTLSSNAAAGAGVKIIDANNQQLIPNDSNSAFVQTDANLPAVRNFDFIARLEADGNTIKSGAFSAVGTFTLTYE